MMLKREIYLERIRPYYESDIIKVITGVRRSGKSVLLDTIRDELIERGISRDRFIYLNLEDIDYDYIVNASDLNKEIKSRVFDKGKYYHCFQGYCTFLVSLFYSLYFAFFIY